MGKAKNVLYTVAAGVAVGMVTGVLFAPAKGKETRGKLRDLKRKLTCSHKDIDDNREALEELSDLLKEELVIVNRKIEKLK
jgi:gas vesicle protein